MKDYLSKFNDYDFFGYILPGSLFCIGLIFIFPKEICGLFEILRAYVDKNTTTINVIVGTALALLASAALYFIGHIIACIAHFFYDRVIVRYLLGYPFYLILNWKNNVREKFKKKTFFFVVLFFIFLLFPLFLRIVGTDYRSIIQFIQTHWDSFDLGLLLLLTIYVLYKLNCFDENDFILRKWKFTRRKATHYKRTPLYRKAVYLFRRSTVTHGCASKKLRRKFEKNLAVRTGFTPKDFYSYSSDIYWFANIYLCKDKESPHAAKLSSWLDMYGCLRNYSCTFILAAVVESFRLWTNISTITAVPSYEFILLIVFILLGILLFARFWVMYYAYYSKYIIRAYALEN